MRPSRHNNVDNVAVLNRLFQIVYRSLPMYLAGADPWTAAPDDPASKALERLIADQKFYSGRLADMVLEYRGRLDSGDFPMEFTDLNMLSMDFLQTELIRCQKLDIAAIEQCVGDLHHDVHAKALAEEVLGNARGHLETLEELGRRPTNLGVVG